MIRLRLERALSPILGLLLFLQAAIVLTGGAVRLTGSGLGCPTWPKCTGGSYTPVPHQPQAQIHVWIEFGNRLFSFILVLTSLAALLVVLILRRRDIRALAIGQAVGTLSQIPLGGITVLTNLNPIAVASHFLLSMILIASATSLYERRKPLSLNLSESQVRNRPLARLHLALTALVIIVGTVVTGTGPNAGDGLAPRFQIGIQSITWIHAGLAITLLLVTIALYLLSEQRSSLRKRIAVFFALSLLQGGTGFLHFYQSFPPLLGGAHILGVLLLWIGAWRIHLASK